jgi:hypothetical protein
VAGWLSAGRLHRFDIGGKRILELGGHRLASLEPCSAAADVASTRPLAEDSSPQRHNGPPAVHYRQLRWDKAPLTLGMFDDHRKRRAIRARPCELIGTVVARHALPDAGSWSLIGARQQRALQPAAGKRGLPSNPRNADGRADPSRTAAACCTIVAGDQAEQA